jgi:hypothetical protein
VTAAGETSFRDHADSSGKAWKAEARGITMASWNRCPPRTRIELEGRVERRGWARNPESGPFAISEAAVSSAPFPAIWHRHPPLLTEDNCLTAFSDREVMFFLV